MSDNVINIPRDTTVKGLVEMQRMAVAGGSNPAASDICYKYLVQQCTSKEEVDGLFVEWWKCQYDSEKYTKAEMLERWFGRVLEDNKVHGVVFPLFGTSSTSIGELTDDSATLKCVPSTAKTLGRDDFAHLPQFWCLEVSAEKNADGSHEIFYVEHIDDINDVRSGEHLCWVLQKNTYTREWDEDGYRYLKMKCHQSTGYKLWREGKDRTGKIHAYIAHPKYYAGIGSDGKITCGTGLAPVNWTSHTAGVTKWRERGTQYSGASGDMIKFLDRMMRLKYARKGNSGTIEGCSNYNLQYTAAYSEEGVERVLLTPTQAANLFVGSSIQLGIQSGSDRNTASNYSICRNKLITKIEEIDIEGTVYSAVYVDNGGTTFDTTAGSTYLSTDPYWSGWNDEVLGTDGSRYNYTNGKEPGLLQKIEFMNGSYLIISDELWQWSTDANGDYNFDCFVCADQSKVSGTAITEDYVKQTDLTMVIPAGTEASWKYIEDTAISDVEWPLGIDAGGSGVGCKAGFYCLPAASGVRAGWCWGNLNNGGNAGLACRNSNNSVGNANWNGSVGSTGYVCISYIAPYSPRLCAKII